MNDTPASVAVPRPEYPRPQFRRSDWLCLNGRWEFEADPGDSGVERGLLDRALDDTILIPFAPEAPLSGIDDPDFHPAVWYRRRFEIPAHWRQRSVLLHFGAVDHDATVWIDGVETARHRGGFTPFQCDLGPRTGFVEVVVRARDEATGPQARGKQSSRYAPHGCFYPRTTGIWQTVWCEPVDDVHMGRPRIIPDLGQGAFHLRIPVSANRRGDRLLARLFDGREEIADADVATHLSLAAEVTLTIPPARVRTWSPADPHLYGIELELVDAAHRVLDAADSYAGLRGVAIDGQKVLLNGEPVFQRLVLDQGFYPDGVMTAPTDADLRRDIELAQDAGFNGARLHQKVFEERFLYHADRAGYLVWSEFPDWGADVEGPPQDRQRPTVSFIAQWLEAVDRDCSHPSIVGWCPLNETRQELGDRITTLDDATAAMFLAAKAVDSTRPVLDASGYSHRVARADVYDAHCYEQDPVVFAEIMSGARDGRPFVNRGAAGETWSLAARGQPYFCSEFGGIWWAPETPEHDGESWGYGKRPSSVEDYLARFEALVAVLIDDPAMFGYCYTQLTDTYQEQNGIYRFDRSPKVPLQRIRAAQTRSAAIESTVALRAGGPDPA